MTTRYKGKGSPHKLGLWPIGLVLLLASCGQVGELKPPPGQPLPVKPKLATTTPTPDELLTPPTLARPVRVDEILTRSEPRRPDRFDLPPPSGAEAAPEPERDLGAPTTSTQSNVQEPR